MALQRKVSGITRPAPYANRWVALKLSYTQKYIIKKANYDSYKF
jgi:hypothetical protein